MTAWPNRSDDTRASDVRGFPPIPQEKAEWMGHGGRWPSQRAREVRPRISFGFVQRQALGFAALGNDGRLGESLLKRIFR